jgi:ubiquinone/menaquinone biosynthesis C-methylase UbiE
LKEIVHSPYDATAPAFEDHRGLPAGVPDAIRSAVWESVGVPARRRVLDLGAGTGRFGRTFVAAGDAYVGVDSSLGMLEGFAAQQRETGASAARLVQADGASLPFADAVFDAVLLMQVLSEGRGWRRLLVDAGRVLRLDGALVVGRTLKPEAGVDARLKSRLAEILTGMGVEPDGPRGQRTNALSWLTSVYAEGRRVEATHWFSERTPRRFIERHQTGHRFAQLPSAVREEAIGQLSEWAVTIFGSLDAAFPETYTFELQIFRFPTAEGAR